jgi:hypothetical protein
MGDRPRETAFMRSIRRRDALAKAEAAGEVADSMDVRKAIMKRFHDGEITLEEAQSMITKIKRDAKKSGKLIRNDFYKRGA